VDGSGKAGERNGSKAEIGSTASRGMGHSEVTLHRLPRGLAAYLHDGGSRKLE
jgi:hypothetical protein